MEIGILSLYDEVVHVPTRKRCFIFDICEEGGVLLYGIEEDSDEARDGWVPELDVSIIKEVEHGW